MVEFQPASIEGQVGTYNPVELLNKDSQYISSLKEAGFSMTEVQSGSGFLNAVSYRKEGAEGVETGRKDNLLLLYAVQGEAGGTTHISTSFLSEMKGEVDTVMGFNSALSFSALEAGKYNHDLQSHADQMVEMYKESIPDDEKDNPIVIVGHSMGGTTSPIVARKLLEQGYNVRDIIMIAPPGLIDRPDVKMLTDFLKLGNKEHITPDLPTLYPSPADIAKFADRHKELKKKKDTTRLSRGETETLAYYELSLQRYIQPDKLLLGNMTEEEQARVRQMDAEQEYLLQEEPTKQDRIDHLQHERTKILVGRTRQVIEGKWRSTYTKSAADGKSCP